MFLSRKLNVSIEVFLSKNSGITLSFMSHIYDRRGPILTLFSRQVDSVLGQKIFGAWLLFLIGQTFDQYCKCIVYIGHL